jgi:hypothetical protein
MSDAASAAGLLSGILVIASPAIVLAAIFVRFGWEIGGDILERFFSK